MGRKKRRSRLPTRGDLSSAIAANLSSVPVNFDGIEIEFRTLDANLNAGRRKPGRPSEPAPTAASWSDATIDVWRQAFLDRLQKFPSAIKTLMSLERRAFQVKDVYDDGTIVGEYADRPNTYRIYSGPGNLPSGCTCAQSDGQYVCYHGYGFTLHALDELGKDSQLARRITARELSKGPIDVQLFRHDQAVDRLNKLLRFINTSPPLLDTDLPPVNLTQRERIAWELYLKTKPPRLAMVVQPLNKKGDGWNKGRPQGMVDIKDSVERTPCEQQIINTYKQEFGSSLGSNTCHVLLRLMGQSNVTYNSEPIEIVAGDSCLRLTEVADGWAVLPVPPANAPDNLEQYFTTDGLLSFDPLARRVYVARATATQARCMEELVKLPPVSKPEHVKLLTERCVQLQKIVSISLPSEFGAIVENVVTPVILLRSRLDGYLDFGFRVRDSLGTLHIPGSGLLVMQGQQNEQPVQFKRSFAVELAIVRKLQQQLGLKSQELQGKLSFEDGLGFLELLEKQAAGSEVLWDKESQSPIRSLGTISSANVRVTIQQKRDWFQLNGQCELSSGNIELSELLETFSSDKQQTIGDYVCIGDRGWAKITQELKSGLQQLADSVNHERGQMKFDRTAAMTMRQLQDQIQIEASRSWQTCLDRLASAETLEPEVPPALQADLRDYQAAGFKWLRRLAEWGVGGVLADDMGLGKTVQTLAVLVDRAKLGPALVIAPTSVGFNWLREIARFAPHLTAHSYRETDRSEFFRDLGPEHIVVCSYGLALRDSEKLGKVAWSSLVLDEAQAIKNSQSKTSQAIATIDAAWKVALTGTPVENHLGELWSLFRIISPGLFGGWEQFRKRFALPIERDRNDERRLALRDRLKPFVLRRTKREVLQDLPARTESSLIVELNDNERKLYDKYRLSVLNQAQEISKLKDVKDQRFRLLALLTRLRQIACHPRLVEENWSERSTKLEQLLETLKELRDEGHRALIFSQFVQHLQLIREMMDEEKITYQYLDGSTTPAQRQEQVDKFQNGDATAFLISLKAGGTGLNLTAADYVFHMDPWWNPAVEDQATDRAHRIGQIKPVMVYRLIAKNTVEEEILKLHEDKRDLVAGILDGTHVASALSTQELISLLTR